MTGNFQDFLSTGSPKEYNNPESFLQNFLSYCIKDFPETKFGLYYHAYCPEFLTFLAGSDLLSNKIPEKLSKHNNIFYQSRNILLLPVSDHEDHIHYIVTVSDWRDIQDQILPLLHNLAAFSKQLFSQIRNTQDQCDLYYANLISQITHDFNSLLNQIDREKVTLPGREYAQNMLKNFLFFVREPDIEFSSVPISEYLEGFLENVKKPTETEIELCTAKTLDVISIDVELFSVALTYILNNAFEAGTGESNRIVIDIYGMKQPSPFIKYDWIVFKISDSGCGIPADYLPMVKNPFFTTRKLEGHCGLGIPIAEKIIKAHNGSLKIVNIEKGRGTEAIIYLPGKDTKDI